MDKSTSFLIGFLCWLVSPANAATIVVDTRVDTLDPPFVVANSCGVGAISDLPGRDGRISLREAIVAADDTPGQDEIVFAPELAGATIELSWDDPEDDDSEADPLPALCSSGTTIDGDIDADGRPDITVDGSRSEAESSGIYLFSNDNVVRNLKLIGFPHSGIRLSHATRSGAREGHFRNSIVGNVIEATGYGVFVSAGIPARHLGGNVAEVDIQGNEIADVSFTGIVLITTEVENSMLRNVQVLRNSVRNSGFLGLGVVNGNFSDSRQSEVTEILIEGNHILDNQAGGITVGHVGRQQVTRGVRIEENIVRTNGVSGVLVDTLCSAGSLAGGIVIARNTITTTEATFPDAPIAIIGGRGGVCGAGAEAASDNQTQVRIENNRLDATTSAAVQIVAGLGKSERNVVRASVVGNEMVSANIAMSVQGGVSYSGEPEEIASDNSVEIEASGNLMSAQDRVSVLLIGGASLATSNTVTLNFNHDNLCAGGAPLGEVLCLPQNDGIDLADRNRIILNLSDSRHSGVASSSEPREACEFTQVRNSFCACNADCGRDGVVTVDEILSLINVVLGNASADVCEAGDRNLDGEITVDEVLAGLNALLEGCPLSDFR